MVVFDGFLSYVGFRSEPGLSVCRWFASDFVRFGLGFELGSGSQFCIFFLFLLPN